VGLGPDLDDTGEDGGDLLASPRAVGGQGVVRQRMDQREVELRGRFPLGGATGGGPGRAVSGCASRTSCALSG